MLPGLYHTLYVWHLFRSMLGTGASGIKISPSQIELVERLGEKAFFRYTEDVSKNLQGGLKGRKSRPKVVVHHENTNDPSRCFIRLYKLYLSKCLQTDRPIHFIYSH